MNDSNSGKPFRSYTNRFTTQNAASIFEASPISGKDEQLKRDAVSAQSPASVSLPPNIFVPEGAQTIDISALANIPPDTSATILRFVGQKGNITRFIGYAIFNDALMLSLLTLVPKVNGNRIFPLHGNPNLKFKMGLGLGPDLSTLVQATCDLQPGDVLTWEITNNDVVDIAVGVRMSGYLDSSTIRKQGRFGG